MVNSLRGKLLVWALVLTTVIGSSKVIAQTQQTELIDDYELTLDEAIQLAVANNPQVKRALLSLDDAKQLVKIAYGEVYPEITSSIGYTRNIELPVSYLPGDFFGQPGQLVAVSFGTDNNWQGGFTVSQTLFRGETIVALSSATVFKTVQEENLRATSQQVITQTRMAYYQVLAANEQLRLQQSQIKRLEENLAENQTREKAGLVDSYDVLSLEVQLSNQRPQLIEAKYGVEAAYRNLKIAMGLPLQLQFKVKGNLNEFDILSKDAGSEENKQIKEIDQMNPYTFEKTEYDSAALALNRGDLRILSASIDLKDKEILAEKSGFLPTLSATYNLQWSAAEPGTPNFFQNPEPNTDPNRFQTVGINLSLPLFQGFKRVADVQRAKIGRKDLEEQKWAAELNAQSEVASASETLNKAFETASARKMALKQAQEGYERATKRLENGLGSQLEVTDAEVQVRQAEVNYALMVYEYLNAKAQYDLATGKVPYTDTESEE